MAILFYDSIDLSAQEIQDVSLEKFATGSIPAGYQGRILYDSSLNVLKYFNGSDYIALDGTGNVDSVTASGGLTTSGSSTAAAVIIIPDYTSSDNIILSAGTSGSLADSSNLLVANGNTVKYYPVSDLPSILLSGVVSVVTTDTTFISMTPTATAATGAVTLTASLSATGTPGSTTYLRGNNTWHAPTPNTNTTYTLPASGGSTAVITLTDGDSASISTVNFTSTAGEVLATESGTNTITFSLPSAVTAPGSLATGGLATINGDMTVATTATITGTLSVTGVAAFTAIPTMPNTGTSSATDAASKAYVDSVVSGGLIFQGGLDATTTTGDATPSAGVLQGWTYAITAGGTGSGSLFSWSPALDEGDLIIAESDTPTVQADWTILQNNVVLATNSTAGIAKFLNGNGFASGMTAGAPALIAATSSGSAGSATSVPVITTTSFGTVDTLSSQNIQLTSGDVSDFDAAVNTQLHLNTHVASIGATATDYVIYDMPAGLDVSVQLYDNSSYETVYARVERAVYLTSFRLTITFAVAPGANTVRCLIIGSKA